MKRLLCILGLAAVLGGCGGPTLQERAEQGDAQAQYELGKLRWDGTEDLAKDRVEAVRWYRKAAEQGLAEAQKALKELGVEYPLSQPRRGDTPNSIASSRGEWLGLPV